MEDDQFLKGDKLVLRGLKFHGFHGVKPEERKLGQKFVIDTPGWISKQLEFLMTCLIPSAILIFIVKEVVEGEPQNLLECVAHKIVQSTFTKFAQISVVRVKVGKPHVAVLGQVDYLGVEILRMRKIDSQS
ncbi:LOW QUALITY PROTEIN: hypothetical protein V2J09_012525 [Rumex salicifolius]